MSVEDLCTLTEMKDGLSSLSRVEELISSMESKKDVMNIGSDAARQGSTVVGTLAATEDKDCLKLFVQLNGVCFLNQWLQDSQKCCLDVSDNMRKGFINASLALLDKLPLDREKLIASGIGITVEHLIGHNSLDIKEKARRLSDKWNCMKINDVNCDQLKDNNTSLNDQSETSLNALKTKDGVDALCPTLDISPANVENSDKKCDLESIGAESHFSNGCDSSDVVTPKGVKSSLTGKLIPTDGGLGDSNPKGCSLVSNSSTGKPFMIGSSDCPAAELTITGKDDSDVTTEVSVGVEEMEVDVSKNGNSPCKSPVKESCTVSPSGLSASLPSTPDRDSKGSNEAATVTPSDSSIAEEKKVSSQMEHESEEIDALEMARQVALEVEREVVDYREPFCSSPEANSGDTIGSHSPEINRDQSVAEDLDGNIPPVGKGISSEVSSPKVQKPQIPENIASNSQEHEQPQDSPKLDSIAHGSAGEFDKNKCAFDLNEDISTEEFNSSLDHIPSITVNLSAPKAVVATSKGTPSLPVTPLKFEGEMGWKGSAATSAFRPASPRRTPESEKGSSGLRKHDFLEFDLNVADSENVMAVGPTIKAEQFPVSSGLPSGDSSVEVSSRRAEMLKLDLNRLGDGEMPMNPSSHWRLQHQNGEQSLSSASSSSSKQPSMKDFDLNHNLSFLDASGSSKVSATNYGGPKHNESFFTIMGSRMAVEPNDYPQAQQSFLGNGLNMEAMMSARQSLPYGHLPPSNGYNGQLSGPAFLFPASPYGPASIPYMVDSRGATVIPQALGPAMTNGIHATRSFFTSAQSSICGVGPSRSGFDLNSCMTSLESASREGGGFRPLFIREQVELPEEQTRISLKPSTSSTMSLKRKEPESGWEPYAVGYKQMASWQ